MRATPDDYEQWAREALAEGQTRRAQVYATLAQASATDELTRATDDFAETYEKLSKEAQQP